MILNRSVRPEPQNDIKFLLPGIERFTLDNGLHVYFVKRDNLPILRFNFIFNAGSKFDPAGRKGLVNLFSMMIDEGAGNYNALELSEEFELLGSSIDVSSNNDNIFLSLRTMKDNYERSLELFSYIIKNPRFDENDFAREKRKILTRILQLSDDPEEMADIVFDYNIFGSANAYAYPVIGYKNDIEQISNNDLKDYYSKYFVPANASLIVVGNTNKDEISKKLNSLFAGWNNSNITAAPEITNKKQDGRIYLVHKEGSVQSEIRIGHVSGKRNHEDFFSKSLLNTILGGQFTSRINLNLREDKGYTYGAFSRLNYYREASSFYVSTSVGAENTGNAISEIFKELNNIRNGVTAEELEFAQSSIIRKFPSNFETNRQIASNIASMIIHSLPEDYFDNYIENVSNVTIDDVNNAALETIFPDGCETVIVGDKNKVLEQLKQFNREIVEVETPVL